MSHSLSLLKRRPKVLIQAKIPAEMHDQLVAFCEQWNTSKSALLRLGLNLAIAELEREASERTKPIKTPNENG